MRRTAQIGQVRVSLISAIFRNGRHLKYVGVCTNM